MKKKTKRATYLAGTIAGLFAIRTIRLAYHRSRLGKFIESIIGGDDQTVKLSQELVAGLPKSAHDWKGRPTEPMNLMLIGTASQIEAAFHRAGWHEAVPINAANWARSFWAGLRDGSYPTGPMTPYYLGSAPQDLSFQKETGRRSFRERHHVRFWETNLRLQNGQRLWLGMASFDRGLKLINGLRFPYHHIDPDLDHERDFIAADLCGQCGQAAGSYILTGQHQGHNDHGDRYVTDGRIKVVDLTGVVA